jgi:peptide/nickel transport system permease protein
MHINYWQELTHHREGQIGLVLLGILAGIALLAPILAPWDPLYERDMAFLAPSLRHLLGTNDVGQDIFSRLLYGARSSLCLAVLAGAGATALSLLIGGTAGLIGGLYDRVVLRCIDALLCIPMLLVLILVAGYLTPSFFSLVLILTCLMWPGGARVVRAETLSLGSELHITAARSFGARWPYLLRRHILPDLAPILLANFVAVARRAVFMEAGLAFLGIGDPMVVSWGMMIRQALRFTYLDAWVWWLLPPGLALACTVAAFAYLGNILTGVLHPRHEGGHTHA